MAEVIHRDRVLKAPFPWFGGKSRAASMIWSRLGDVKNYVEPFFGSGAVMLGRPNVDLDDLPLETVNDADGFVANFWRAVAHDPEAVAHYADNPVNENDLHARHSHLVNLRPSFVPRLEGDPDFYDAKIAGWWCWGICCWIGSGWCSGNGPWNVVDGKLIHLGDKGQGVNRQRAPITDWMLSLSDRLRRVRVCCGDWSRVCGPTPTVKQGLTGVVLDPPYSTDERTAGLYAHDDGTVADKCREWALQWGDDPRMRIVLCGYDTEHEMPGWVAVPWTAHGGYSSEAKGGDNGNKHREVLWFSPHCMEDADPAQATLFEHDAMNPREG